MWTTCSNFKTRAGKQELNLNSDRNSFKITIHKFPVAEQKRLKETN